MEAARPELVLGGWDRLVKGEGDAARELIVFQTVKNVGRGNAHGVMVRGFLDKVDNRPTAVTSSMWLPIVAVGKIYDIEGEITLWWKNVRPDDKGRKHLPIVIKILCWDDRGTRHETRYELFALHPSSGGAVADAIVPGVMLLNRTTRTRSVWLLKLSAWMRLKLGQTRIYRKYIGPKYDDDRD